MAENDNEAPAPTMVDVNQPTMTEEEAVKILQAKIATLLDSFKSLFVPEMKITFIARHPEELPTYSFMTEDSKEELIKFLERVEPPKPLVRVRASDAVN